MGLIKHFNDLLAYLMKFEKVLEMNPFQDRPAPLSGCIRSLEAASSAMNGGPVLGSTSPHFSVSSLPSVGCSHWLSCPPAMFLIPWVPMCVEQWCCCPPGRCALSC